MAGKLFETTVGVVCQVFDGPHATPTRLNAGPVFLGITSLNKGRIDLSASDHVSEEDFTKWTRRVTPKPGDVVFSYETKLGEAAIIPEGLRCCLGRRMGLMRPDPKKLDSRFLLFYYLGPEFQEVIRERTIHGSTVERLALIEFPQFPLRIPPLADQKAIAAVLGTLDDKIELNRRMNATLESMARALFQSWFVDFDPVRAKLDGRQPPGLDSATAALFPATFQDSPLGPMPHGWTAQRLPEAIEVNPRRRLKTGVIAPYLDMKNLPTQGHSAEEVIDREFSSGTKFQNGDTLLARITPCLENGKTGYVDFLEDGQVGWGSTEYIVLAPKPPLPPQFGYLLARSHAIQNMTGTSRRQRVPSECFNTFLHAVPTSEVAHRFDELTAPLMTKIKANLHRIPHPRHPARHAAAEAAVGRVARARRRQTCGGARMSAAFGARTLVRFTVRTNEGLGIIRARRTWRALKRAEARAPIPTGLRPKAQGCEAPSFAALRRGRRATLGDVPKHFPQPQRGCGPTPRDGHNLVEVEKSLRQFPKVARSSQPWAGGHCPVGAKFVEAHA